uniref:Uncharacterized protein n=1 Tax=Solanum lycopersicum TaxID=4081 RepID=A0A3Q7IEM6_SOLLC
RIDVPFVSSQQRGDSPAHFDFLPRVGESMFYLAQQGFNV